MSEVITTEYSRNVLIQAATRANNEATQLKGLTDGGLGFEFEEFKGTTEQFAAMKLRVMAKRVEHSSNFKEAMIEAAKMVAQLSNLKQMTDESNGDIDKKDPLPSFLTNTARGPSDPRAKSLGDDPK